MVEGATKKKGPSLLVSWIVIAVGLAATILGVFQGVRSLSNGVLDSFAVGRVEGGAEIDARKGTYYVFQLVGELSSNDAGTPGGQTTLRASEVTVTAPDGSRVPTFPANSVETYTKGVAEYQAAVKFTAPRDGIYRVRVTNDETPLLVRRAAFDLLGRSLTWFGVAALGGLGLALGIILLIVGVIRRSHSTPPVLATTAPFTLLPTAAPMTGVPAPGAPAVPGAPLGGGPAGGATPTAAGWYPDPWQQATWRYHDGTAWTSHTG